MQVHEAPKKKVCHTKLRLVDLLLEVTLCFLDVTCRRINITQSVGRKKKTNQMFAESCHQLWHRLHSFHSQRHGRLCLRRILELERPCTQSLPVANKFNVLTKDEDAYYKPQRAPVLPKFAMIEHQSRYQSKKIRQYKGRWSNESEGIQTASTTVPLALWYWPEVLL